MKRSTALADLSRDHHHALVVAQRLRRATAETAAEDRSAFLDYWRSAGHEHFREEEEILLPAFAAHGDPHHPLVARVLCEHVAVRAAAAALEGEEGEPDLGRMHEFGTTLADHVRLEERQLFPLIEETLPPDDLERVGALLAGE